MSEEELLEHIWKGMECEDRSDDEDLQEDQEYECCELFLLKKEHWRILVLLFRKLYIKYFKYHLLSNYDNLLK